LNFYIIAERDGKMNSTFILTAEREREREREMADSIPFSFCLFPYQNTCSNSIFLLFISISKYLFQHTCKFTWDMGKIGPPLPLPYHGKRLMGQSFI
jgi:hypothetical protein